MTEDKRKLRNCSIDIFRYLCAVMVVGIHTHPLSELNNKVGYICSDIVPRIAVPFFFAAAGYFYIRKLEKGQNPFFPYVKRLLIPYFIWSVIYDMVDFMVREHTDMKSFLQGCIYRFVVTGSYEHFWFFPALIFSVCLTTLLFKVGSRKMLIPLSIFLYIIGCLGCAYYNLAVQLPGLGSLFSFSQFNLIRRVLLMGFPFFICGYFVYKIEERIRGFIADKILYFSAGIIVLIWLAEIYAVRMFGWENNIIITFGLYPLVAVTLLILLRNPLPAYRDFSDKCAALADFTYYSHPLFMEAFSLAGVWLLHREISATPMFLLTVSTTFAIGLFVQKWKLAVCCSLR